MRIYQAWDGEMAWRGASNMLHLSAVCSLKAARERPWSNRTEFGWVTGAWHEWEAAPLCPRCLEMILEDGVHIHRRAVRRRDISELTLAYFAGITYQAPLWRVPGDKKRLHVIPCNKHGCDASTFDALKSLKIARLTRHRSAKAKTTMTAKQRRLARRRLHHLSRSTCLCEACYELLWRVFVGEDSVLLDAFFPLLPSNDVDLSGLVGVALP